jgi:hypothetical protein
VSSLEAAVRAINEEIGGHPELWRGTVDLIRRVLPKAAPHLPGDLAKGLSEFFGQDVGEGPADPDPGF